MWLDGLSASQIAKALGTGRSRNAVIGRVHRHGLPVRLDPKRSYKKNRRAPYIKPARKVIYIPVAAARVRAPVINPRKTPVRADQIESLDVPLIELQSWQCKAITKDERFNQRCCGQYRDEGSPYCADHRALYRSDAKERAA